MTKVLMLAIDERASMLRYAFPLLCIAAGLAGCASLTKEECRAANWTEIGQRDGAAGRLPEYLARHVKACARVDVTPNQTLWEDGRQSGLPLYCRPAKVYDEGRRGRALSPVCPAADIPALRAAHEKGRAYYRIGREIDEIEDDIDQIGDRLVSEDDKDTRAALVRRMERLRRDIARLELERQRYASL